MPDTVISRIHVSKGAKAYQQDMFNAVSVLTSIKSTVGFPCACHQHVSQCPTSNPTAHMAVVVQLPPHKLSPCHAALLCLPLDTADAATTAVADSSETSSDRSSKQGRKQQQRQRQPNSDSVDRSSSSSSSSSIDAKNSRMQANTLYVQNLAWSTMSEHLQDTFCNCPGYEDAFIKLNKNGRPAGYGFVRFSSEEAAAAAEAVRKEIL
jgi:hypothetical protein